MIGGAPRTGNSCLHRLLRGRRKRSYRGPKVKELEAEEFETRDLEAEKPEPAEEEAQEKITVTTKTNRS